MCKKEGSTSSPLEPENSMPQRMVGPPTQNLMDNKLLQDYLCCLCSRFSAGFYIVQDFDCGM